MTIGNKIKTLRESAGVTQTELGKACGTTKQTIFKYENGVITNIPIEKVEKIAEVLNTTPAYLMGWDENKDELQDYLEELRSRPEMRMLFSISKDATKEDVEKAVAIIEALRKQEGR